MPEHAEPPGHAFLTLLADVGCMCVGAREVIPKRRAHKESESTVEHQEESVAAMGQEGVRGSMQAVSC